MLLQVHTKSYVRAAVLSFSNRDKFALEMELTGPQADR